MIKLVGISNLMAMWISEIGTSNKLRTCHPVSVRIGSWLPFMNTEKKQCKYCKIELKKGIALDYTDPDYRPAYRNYNRGELIRCWKCPKCGYSED